MKLKMETSEVSWFDEKSLFNKLLECKSKWDYNFTITCF